TVQRAADLAEEGGRRPEVAAAQGALGVVLLALGERDAAREALEASLEAARASGQPAIEAATLNNLGNLTAGEPDAASAALRLYDQANERAIAAGDLTLAGRSQLNAARLLARTGDPDAAAGRLRDGLARLDEAPAGSSERARESLSAGLIARSLDGQGARPDDRLLAHELLTRAARLAETEGDRRTQSYALGQLGELYMAEGRDAEALVLTRRALFLAQAAEAPEVLYRWQWQVGRLLARGGEIDPAIVAYQGAVRTLQSIRRELPAFDPETGRSLFRETVGPVFLELADLLLRQAGGQEGDVVQANLRKAREVVELLKTAELEDYFQDDCVALLQARAKPIDQIEARSAALYPIILPDRLELLLSVSDGLIRATVPVPGVELEETARAFRTALVSFSDPEPAARKLHGWLIEPFLQALTERQVDTLIFVPDGALRLIPLAALEDGDGYLVERFAVATAPGLSLLDAEPLGGRTIRPLLSGLTEEVQGFPPLPSVAEELQAIEAMYGGTVLTNQEFNEQRLRAELDAVPYNVVHIASHAQFASDPDETFLLTHDGRILMDELEDLIKVSRFRDEPVELIGLSACETAAGDDRAALGLAGIAVKAGARSALATRWLVDDVAAARLSADFYQNLGVAGTSKAKALQQAQVGLLDEFDHPFFWAPFLLIGNWL
ncbi:MAG: CHAT domain-containing protein, partial [Geminicoccaceae bacterium]|nr:CHAT domain-containing protein [Geminicoccaceae bacterium]